jgi:hypothetical protein
LIPLLQCFYLTQIFSETLCVIKYPGNATSN